MSIPLSEIDFVNRIRAELRYFPAEAFPCSDSLLDLLSAEYLRTAAKKAWLDSVG